MNDRISITPLVGLSFGGDSATEWEPAVTGQARIGRPVWGPSALLRDLELRLGVAGPDAPRTVRLQQWQRHLAEHAASRDAFYARSLEHDPIGTTAAVVRMRDDLLDAGWDGAAIKNGGPRLDTIAALASPALPPGDADRLRRVEEALNQAAAAPYPALMLAEAHAAWPGRWRRIFERLEALGADVGALEVQLGDGADPKTDLGRVQALLRGDATAKQATVLQGDDSLVLLRAETCAELADAAAAVLASKDAAASTVVIRGGEVRTLDLALEAHGLSTQGVSDASPWRPALQILPLALELLFAPKDPCRVLELVTLPDGPFSGMTGRELARALGEAPGVGGPAWEGAKEEIDTRTREKALQRATAAGEAAPAAHAEQNVSARRQRIAEWLEIGGYDAVQGVPRAVVLEHVARVRDFLRTRMVLARESAEQEAQAAALGAAHSRADELHAALSHDPQDRFDRFRLWHLLDDVSGGGHAEKIRVARAGRLDVADNPAGLRRSYDTVVWWHAVSGTEWRPAARPWRRSEVQALVTAGVHFSDPAARLKDEAGSWRRAVLAARGRLVLAVPRNARGQRLDPHPIWDEIVARLGVQEAQLSTVSHDVSALLEDRKRSAGLGLQVTDLEPLALPLARAEWSVPGSLLSLSANVSASQLEALVGCPLKWALSYRAGLRGGAVAGLADGPLLYGKLTHRLAELIAGDSALDKPAQIGAAIERHFDTLIEQEAALLLRAGQSFDLVETRRSITHSLSKLAALLDASKLTVKGVETHAEATWRGRTLSGRLDVLLEDQSGREIVLDLKWGRSSYTDRLKRGVATQLAVYAAARKLETKSKKFPPAAYYALGRGELLATDTEPFADVDAIDGPPIEETWKRLETTVVTVEKLLAAGRLPVTGVTDEMFPLLEAAGVLPAAEKTHLLVQGEESCGYCDYGAVCGRQWGGVQ